jgi:hypothetical protein
VYASVFAVPATPTLILFCVVSHVRIPVAVETPVAPNVLNPNWSASILPKNGSIQIFAVIPLPLH